MATFPTEESCKQFLMERRWQDGVVTCPKCGNPAVYKLHTRPFHWLCKLCKNYRFSVISGTIFENTKYPLKSWFEVLWQMLNSKKGVSALQIQRQIGSGAYKTAWYMCHRLRAAMKDPDFRQLMGIVEVDETFLGGKDKNRHWDKKSHVTGGIGSGKVGVIGAISRKGNVVCQIIENTDAATLNRFVRKAVTKRSATRLILSRPTSTAAMAILKHSATATNLLAIARVSMFVAKYIPTIWKTSGAC